jgi:hypothetical protein
LWLSRYEAKNKKIENTPALRTLPQISSHHRFSWAIKVHAYMHYKSNENERLYNDDSQQDLAMNTFSDTEHGNTQFCVILTWSELWWGGTAQKAVIQFRLYFMCCIKIKYQAKTWTSRSFNWSKLHNWLTIPNYTSIQVVPLLRNSLIFKEPNRSIKQM